MGVEQADLDEVASKTAAFSSDLGVRLISSVTQYASADGARAEFDFGQTPAAQACAADMLRASGVDGGQVADVDVAACAPSSDTPVPSRCAAVRMTATFQGSQEIVDLTLVGYSFLRDDVVVIVGFMYPTSLEATLDEQSLTEGVAAMFAVADRFAAMRLG